MFPEIGYLLALEIFFLVTYVAVLVPVVRDILRDSRLGGVAQALWVFFLLVVPVIPLLVYLVVRGPGMARRRRAAARDIALETQEYTRAVAAQDLCAARVVATTSS